jgi:endonuclease/exonuclease/phosphatase (EEP) superfamily protein YafD
LVLVVCIVRRHFRLAVAAGLICAINISPIINAGSISHAAKLKEEKFSIYSANIQKRNKDFSRLKKELNKIDPDIILLIEVTPDHFDKLRFLTEKYPHYVRFSPVGTCEIGVMLFSKFPVLSFEKQQLSKYGNVLLKTVLKVNNKKILFYGIHARNPGFIKDFQIRKEQFLMLARDIREKSLPAIVAGDFNATPYSPIFRKLLEEAKLKDTRDGFGWLPSWPSRFPPLWIPIDHILVSHEFDVLNRKIGSFIGSDHYPVYAELSFRS